MPETSTENVKDDAILERIDYLERRVGQLESLLGVRKVSLEEFKEFDKEDVPNVMAKSKSNSTDETAMESRIGESGLGWLGSIVLLFGIAFIIQYIQSLGQPLTASLFGYIAVGIVFFVAYYIRKTIVGLSSKLNTLNYILLFYVTLRLHFFTDTPLISAAIIPLILLVIISLIQFYFANKKGSEFLAIVGFILLLTTANISGTTHLMLTLVTLGAIFSIYLLYKNSWWKLVLTVQFLTYVSFVIWYLINNYSNNAIPKELTDHYSITYLFICVSAFSMITLIKQRETISEAFVFVSIMLNGLFFTLILTLYVMSFYLSNYIGIFISISIICILFSVFLNRYSEWKYTPALYALYGFIAMSTAIYGIFGLPLSFLLLTIQSLLVVSLAIWFRSKLIVVLNFGLFVFLMLAYHLSSDSIDSINFAFAFIAIISARIINLQSKRLDIKTDMMRNVYLIFAFFSMLFALYMAVPKQYVTLSWSIAAVAYFLFSILIHNIKYRWMAIATMIAAALYLFLVDLASVGIIYRIVAFMFLAIISITISIYYTKRKKKHHSEEAEEKK